MFNRTIAFAVLLCLATAASGQRVGLVLSGGGATAMAHIGVMKALEENNIPIDFITGSSMGALVGGLYAAGYSPWQIDSLFSSEQFRIMAEGGIEPEFTYFFKQDTPDASLISLRFDLDTLLTTSLPTNLRSPVLLDFEQMRGFAPVSAAAGYSMDSLFVPFRCVASDITAQRAHIFRSGDLSQAIRASMSYPFYFKPILPGHHHRQQRVQQFATAQRGRPAQPIARHGAGTHQLLRDLRERCHHRTAHHQLALRFQRSFHRDQRWISGRHGAYARDTGTGPAPYRSGRARRPSNPVPITVPPLGVR
jgi:hypothetical protein